MFNRSIIEHLTLWSKKKERKPLILRGARQVGKTTIVNLFSKNFEQYIYLNLEKSEDRRLFEKEYPFNELIEAIFFYKNKNLNVGKTLIFIDEIQNSPKAVASLRYFYEEASKLYVIAAGSLLESVIDKGVSFPVGRVEFMAVRPCSFNEFLVASGEMNSSRLLKRFPTPDYSHDKLLGLFNRFTLIGGMPQIIENYIQYRDITKLSSIYDSLLISYIEDVEKYARNQNNSNIIRHIISSSFPFAASRIKFQGFGNSLYRSREVGEAFRVLEKTMLIKLSYPITNCEFPLQQNLKKSPRLHLLDTGLVNYFSNIQKDIFLASDISDVYRGKIAEHIIGQEILSNELSVLANLYFWTKEKKQSNAEVDYIINHNGLLIPVEVKSGATGRLRSLHQYMDSSSQKYAVRIWAGKFGVENAKTIKNRPFTLINIPFYLTGNLDKVLDAVMND